MEINNHTQAFHEQKQKELLFRVRFPLGGREGEKNKEQRKYSEMVLAVK